MEQNIELEKRLKSIIKSKKREKFLTDMFLRFVIPSILMFLIIANVIIPLQRGDVSFKEVINDYKELQNYNTYGQSTTINNGIYSFSESKIEMYPSQLLKMQVIF